MCINCLSPIRLLSFLVVFTVLLAFSAPAKAEDNTFTSEEFLTWKESSQDFYIEACAGMAAFIAAQIDGSKDQAKCISKWYYKDETESNAFIRSVMREHSEFHPRAIVLGVLEKRCGEF